MAESALLLVSVGQMVSVMAWKDGLIQEAAALLSYALAAAFLRFPFLSDLNSKFKLRKDGHSRSGVLLGLLLAPSVLAAKIHLSGSSELDTQFYRFYFFLSLCSGFSAIVYGALANSGTAFLVALASSCALPCLLPLFLSGINWLTVAPPLLSTSVVLWALLTHFPRCFTFGEAVFLAQAFSLSISDAFYYTLALLQLDLPSYLTSPRDEIQMFLTALIPGMLLCGTVLFPTIRKSAQLSRERAALFYSKSKDDNQKGWQLAIGFYTGTLGIVVMLLHPWLSFTTNGREPIMWTLRFVFGEPTRVFLCVYWVATLGGCLLLINMLRTKWPSIPNILVRKYFHALSLLLFIPAIFLELRFIKLSFGVALSSLIFIEYVRAGRIDPLGAKIDSFMRTFIDERDAGSLILTHLYLLVGCAAPVWLYTPSKASQDVYFILPYLGVLLVGLGDSFASLAGMYLGRIRWPHTKKTVEGTAAAIAVVLVAGLLLAQFHPSVMLSSLQWLGLIWAVVCGCLLEAFTTQIDNLALPLYTYAIMCFSY